MFSSSQKEVPRFVPSFTFRSIPAPAFTPFPAPFTPFSVPAFAPVPTSAFALVLPPAPVPTPAPVSVPKTRTCYHSGIIPRDKTQACYEYLSKNIPWTVSVPSRKEPGVITRLGCLISLNENEVLRNIVVHALGIICPGKNVPVHQIYLNWYRNGYEYCPNHSHPGTRQVVISLGATRTLKVGKKDYPMASGDAIVFGSSIHGIPREVNVTEGRISIAVFLDK